MKFVSLTLFVLSLSEVTKTYVTPLYRINFSHSSTIELAV